MPPQPTDFRDAMHWFVDEYGQYISSTRSLFATDVSLEQEAYLESAVVNLRGKGIEPFIITGEVIAQQADLIWQNAIGNSPFGQPYVSTVELDYLGSPVVIVKDLVAPEQPHHLWYLYHYILYPRLLQDKPCIITTPLGIDEFFAYGSQCEDFEYAGYKATWDKVMWILNACMIDLYQFRQVKSEGLPPMLKAEYHLFNAIKERELSVVSQQILGDYQLDISVTDGNNRLAIEIDKLSSLDLLGQTSDQSKKNFVLLSDGWKIIRFTANEVLEDLSNCADAVEQIWKQGRKKASVGRLLFGKNQPSLPALPQDDEVQKLAITNGGGPVAITGCAGTGKTYSVAHRIEYLLAQGVSPERILAFTHSEETRADLEKAVGILTDKQTVQRLNISDWQDIGYRILKENATGVNRKPPLKREVNPQRVFERVLKKVKNEYDDVQLELINQDISESSLRALISLYKANLVTVKHVQEHGQTEFDQFAAKVYKSYDDQMKKSNKVDKDDCVALCAHFLAEDSEARRKYSSKYDYVLVDEFQECTTAQNLLVRLLAYPQDNLFMVGDEDEALTEAQGAQIRVLAETSIRMPNARCYSLENNWRSHKTIVKSARALLGNMSVRTIAKDMNIVVESKTRNAIIGPNESKNEKEEAEWVAKEVAILVQSGKMPHEIAILWNNQSYATILEAALFKENIRSSASGPAEGEVPDEVGDVLAFLSLVMDPDGPKARQSFERICQLRSRELDQKLSKLSSTIASFAEANSLSFLKAIEIYYEATNDSACKDLNDLVRIVRTMNQEGLPPAETINLLKRTQKLREIYKSANVPAGVVYEPMQKVEQLQEEAREYKTVKDFLKAKEKLASSHEGDEDQGFVSIRSIDDSKGKEFPVVFVVGLAHGVFPAEEADLEEERRRFYVAITRAKELLYLSNPIAFENKLRIPSQFLVEAEIISMKAYDKRVESRSQEQLPVPGVDASIVPPDAESPLSAQEEAVLAKEREKAALEAKQKEEREAAAQAQTEQVTAAAQAKVEEETRQQAEQQRLQAEQEAAAAQAKAEEEARQQAEQQKQQAEQQRQQAEQEAAAAQAKAEEEARQQAEQQRQQAEQEAAAAQAKAEEEARQQAEQQRLQAEQEAAAAQAKAEEEARQQAEQQRLQAEQKAAAAQAKAEEEARQQAEQQRLQAEQEAAAAQAKAEEEARQQAEQQRLQAEQEAAAAQARAEEEARQQAEQQRQQAEQEAAVQTGAAQAPTDVSDLDTIFGDIGTAKAGTSLDKISVDSGVEAEETKTVEEVAQPITQLGEAASQQPIESADQSKSDKDEERKRKAKEKLEARAKKKQEEARLRAEQEIKEAEDAKNEAALVEERKKEEERKRAEQEALAMAEEEKAIKEAVAQAERDIQEAAEARARARAAAFDQIESAFQNDQPTKEEKSRSNQEIQEVQEVQPVQQNQQNNSVQPDQLDHSVPLSSPVSQEEGLSKSQDKAGRYERSPLGGDSDQGFQKGSPFSSGLGKGAGSGKGISISVSSSPIQKPQPTEPIVEDLPVEALEEERPQLIETDQKYIPPQHFIEPEEEEAPQEDEAVPPTPEPSVVVDSGQDSLPEDSSAEVLEEEPVQESAPLNHLPIPQASLRPAQLPTMEGTTRPMCPHCMILLEVGSRFCGECGYQLEVRIPACPSCSEPVVPGAKFCGECGFGLQQAQ